MFEDSLFASKADGVQTQSRWATAVAVGVQGLALVGLLLAPMLRPLAMAGIKTAPAVVSLTMRRPEVKANPVRVRTSASDVMTPHVPSPSAQPEVERRAPGSIHETVAATDGPPEIASGGGMSSGPLPGGSLLTGTGLGAGTGSGGGARVSVKASGPMRISSGVSAGMLLMPIRPVYPAIARMARLEGTVVITATIDKSGRIAGLQVLSGPEMLRTAAVDAVKEARYRPYTLNGEATEVVTTISVNFRMGA